MRQQLPTFTVTLTLLICAVTTVKAQQRNPTGAWQTYDTSNGEWRSYAGDIGGKK